MIQSNTLYTAKDLQEQGIGRETLRQLKPFGVTPVRLGAKGQHWFDGGQIIEAVKRQTEQKKATK